MKKYLILVIFIIPSVALAQQGQITIVQDTSIDRVLKIYSIFSKEKRQVNGFRIQLATNNNRQYLLATKSKFIQQYPDVPSYIQYSAPQFKLRAGDFTSRTEADIFCNEARIYFSSAFVVPDKIIIQGVEW